MDGETVKLVLQTVALVAGGIATAYGLAISLRNRMDKNSAEIKVEIAAVRKEVGAIDKRVSLIEQDMKQGSNRFSEHNNEISRVRDKLHDIELDLVAAQVRGAAFRKRTGKVENTPTN